MKLLLPTLALFMAVFIMIIPHSYAECSYATNHNFCPGITDTSAAPHLSGMRTCEGFTFGNVVGDVICKQSNTEGHILAGQAVDNVPVFYNGLLIAVIDHGAVPTGEPHRETVSFGGQHFKIPLWAYYEISQEGNLLHKGEGYQYVGYNNLGEKHWMNPEKTYERVLTYAKYQGLIYAKSY